MATNTLTKTQSSKYDYASLFPHVSKPSRYIGGEWNSRLREDSFRRSAVGVCLCFPDLYETGFANGGLEILYRVINARPDSYAERAYSVADDMGALLKKKGWPLFSLESRTPLAAFDIIGFGLPYELCYTNILEMLHLSQIPLRSRDRKEGHPLVIGGGPCSVNPEPVVDFFDAVVIGDGEEIMGEIIDIVKAHKGGPVKNRSSLLRSLAGVEGLYVPSLYDVLYNADGTILEVSPNFEGAAKTVSYRRASLDLPGEGGRSGSFAPVVPFVQTVHDRLNVEIQRGCPWRCRFCQAGFTYRPYRERSREDLLEIISEGLRNTGYDSVTLAGLSAADHTEIIPILQELSRKFTPKKVAIGLPSTRADRFTLALAEILQDVRRQSITFAPEAGTERMRRVIRKELQESEIRETLSLAYRHGWKSIKLYFMYGLPTETQEDLEGIVSLIRSSRKENPGLSFTLTLSPFVPKPHTPCQWHPQEPLETLKKKLEFLRRSLPAQIRAHNLEQIVLEGVLSRGDRRCSVLLETAWKLGARFDEWSERFSFGIWQKAFSETGLSPDFFCYRPRSQEEKFPWDHLQGGPERRALWNDYQTALRQSSEPLPVPHLKERPKVSSVAPKFPARAERSVQTLRFRMSRLGSVRFLSHLEQIEMVRRSLRRAEFPLAYTSGYHPQIKCSFGPAISVGYESECEYFDVDFCERLDAVQAMERLSSRLPNGFSLLKVSRVPLFFPSLESLLNRVDYEISGDCFGSISGSLDGDGFFLEKEKASKDGKVTTIKIPLKPLILKAERTEECKFFLSLRLGPGMGAKPEKVLSVLLKRLETDASGFSVKRKALYIVKPDGSAIEP